MSTHAALHHVEKVEAERGDELAYCGGLEGGVDRCGDSSRLAGASC
jgi:hypothetical protein